MVLVWIWDPVKLCKCEAETRQASIWKSSAKESEWSTIRVNVSGSFQGTVYTYVMGTSLYCGCCGTLLPSKGI